MTVALINNSNPFHKVEVGTFADCLAVRVYLADAGFKILAFEEDADNRGFYDIMAAKGRLDVVQFEVKPDDATLDAMAEEDAEAHYAQDYDS